jgi:hypothetical protein
LGVNPIKEKPVFDTMTQRPRPSKQRRTAEPIAARIVSDLLEGANSTIVKEPTRQLEAFVVHQDLHAGLRAKQTLEDAGRQLNPGASLRPSLWRMELLEDPALRKEAVSKAARADIVLLSLYGDRPLATGLWQWFEQWTLVRGEGPCVLVVSFDERFRYASAARELLGDLHIVAAARGLEVIPHFDFTPAESGSVSGVMSGWNSSTTIGPLPGQERDLSAGEAPIPG